MKTIARPKGHVWDDLHAQEPLSREEILADAFFYRAFSTPDGQKTLEYMHLLTTFRRNNPNDPDGALRELEAQRRFVAIIEARVARHLKGTKANVGRRNRRDERSGGAIG